MFAFARRDVFGFVAQFPEGMNAGCDDAGGAVGDVGGEEAEGLQVGEGGCGCGGMCGEEGLEGCGESWGGVAGTY